MLARVGKRWRGQHDRSIGEFPPSQLYKFHYRCLGLSGNRKIGFRSVPISRLSEFADPPNPSILELADPPARPILCPPQKYVTILHVDLVPRIT
jgi:hypothetical protein